MPMYKNRIIDLKPNLKVFVVSGIGFINVIYSGKEVEHAEFRIFSTTFQNISMYCCYKDLQTPTIIILDETIVIRVDDGNIILDYS